MNHPHLAGGLASGLFYLRGEKILLLSVMIDKIPSRDYNILHNSVEPLRNRRRWTGGVLTHIRMVLDTNNPSGFLPVEPLA